MDGTNVHVCWQHKEEAKGSKNSRALLVCNNILGLLIHDPFIQTT